MDAILAGRPSGTDFTGCLRAQEVIAAALESAAMGHVVAA